MRIQGLPFFQRQFLFFVVLVEHGQRIAEHVGPQHLHGALRGLVFLAQTRAIVVEAVVVLLLVGKAAEQTAADARDFGGVEEQVLLLGHADGHGSELAQVPAAAADHAAVAHGPHHLGLVAHPYLAQFDAGAVFAHQILDQLAKVDAGRRREIENELAAVKKDLNVHELHVQAAVTDALAAELRGLAGQFLVGTALGQVFFRGPALDGRQALRLHTGHIIIGTGDHLRQGLPLICRDQHMIAHGQIGRARMVQGLSQSAKAQTVYWHSSQSLLRGLSESLYIGHIRAAVNRQPPRPPQAGKSLSLPAPSIKPLPCRCPAVSII